MKSFFKAATAIALIGFSSISLAKGFSDRKEVQNFIDSMVTKYKFDKQKLHSIFSQYDRSDDVIKFISRPYEALDWGRYQKLFITKERVVKGVKFWNKNSNTLSALEKKYGVPAEIMVAIVGVETYYGKNKGKYPVIQALSTLSFDYPKRAKFFKKQLEEFLIMTKEQSLDPLSIKGSYAGAMGIPQFIPSSYRSFAVGFNGKKPVDIINDTDTALASVANYLKKNGWKREPYKINQAIVSGDTYKSFITTKIGKPKYTLQKLNKNGILASKKLQKSDKLSLIKLETGNNNEYWLVDNNFYVITTYNRSYNYAMAVYQLSQEIKKQKQNESKKS